MEIQLVNNVTRIKNKPNLNQAIADTGTTGHFILPGAPMDEGDILDPYDGHVKSIFLPDDQQPLSRTGGVQKLENSLIGKVNTLGW